MDNIDEETEDRELFTELTESTILPTLVHMDSPCKHDHDPHFSLKINGKALWLWRKAEGRAKIAFNVLQACLPKLGYKLKESACERVGHQLAKRVRTFLKQLQMTSGRKRQMMKAETWINMAIKPTEIDQFPFDIISEHAAKETELIDLNDQLQSKVDEQAAELYKIMEERRRKKRSGRDFASVGERQQRRILSEVE